MYSFFEKLAYRLLVQSTTMEDDTFPYKTAPSKTNVKANKMESTKWIYQNKWGFATNYFIFLKI